MATTLNPWPPTDERFHHQKDLKYDVFGLYKNIWIAPLTESMLDV